MELLLRPWRRYADFGGRSRRLEFVLFFVCYYGLFLALGFLVAGGDAIARLGGGQVDSVNVALLVVIGIGALAGLIPAWAVSIRRVHDIGVPGWWVLLTLIPYLGWIARLWMVFAPGEKYENRYGSNPRDPAGADADRLQDVFS